jgi:hypothetical protein
VKAEERHTAPVWALLSDEQRAALRRHGYPDDLQPRGVTGKPGDRIPGYGWLTRDHEGQRSVPMWLRNRVCYLDGIRIDGHEGSDLDPGEPRCMHCGETDEKSAAKSVDARLRDASAEVTFAPGKSRKRKKKIQSLESTP